MFRAARRQPSRLLAQTVSVSPALATSRSTKPTHGQPTCCLPQTAPGGQCQAFGHRRHTFDSASGPSRPRPRRPSFLPTSRSLPAVWSLRSPARVPVKAQHPTLQRPPPGPTLRCASGPLWFRDSGPCIRLGHIKESHVTSRATVPVQRLKTIEVNQGTHARASSQPPPTSHARGTVKGFIYIQQGAAAEPLRVLEWFWLQVILAVFHAWNKPTNLLKINLLMSVYFCIL